MFGHESRIKLREIFCYYAEQEIAIEKIRQILAAMRDFEPYTAFRRIDRDNNGTIDANSFTHFQRENGFRELEPQDFKTMINYFDLD
jgi:Ca2+-binding EF-hand superfamily protein